MAKNDEDDIIFFYHNGRKVSNDPRWQLIQAQKEQARKAEVQLNEDYAPEEELVTAPEPDESPEKGVEEGSEGVEENSEENEENEDDTQDEPDEPEFTPDYSALTGKELKAEVKARKERGREIDTSGVTKKSELIALLQADDTAQQ